MVLRRFVVERKDLRLSLRLAAGQALGGCCRLAVQLPAPSECEAVVRDLAHRRLPEAPAFSLGLQEAAELRGHRHRSDAVGDIVGEEDTERFDEEAPSEHRRTAEETPIIAGSSASISLSITA